MGTLLAVGAWLSFRDEAAQGDGIGTWAPALVAAVRRAADAGAEGRALMTYAAEPTVVALDVRPGEATFDDLDDDAAHDDALSAPELAAAFEAGGAVWIAHWGGVHRSRDQGATWEIALAKDALLAYGIAALSASEAVVVRIRGLAMVGRGGG